MQRERKDDVADLYDEEGWQGRLAVIIERRYLSMLRAIHNLVADVLGLDPVEAFRLDDTATRAVLEQAAERVVRIDSTTRDALRELLQRGQELGLSGWEIANGSPKDGFPGIEGLFRETWKGRAETISRTEIGTAQIVSAQDRYRASGMVKRQRIVDGDYDEACASRNGRVVPITESVGLLHPNCRATVIPIVEASA